MPAAQLTHAVDPEMSAYNPTAQELQLVAAVNGMYCPALQLAQLLAPVTAEN